MARGKNRPVTDLFSDVYDFSVVFCEELLSAGFEYTEPESGVHRICPAFCKIAWM